MKRERGRPKTAISNVVLVWCMIELMRDCQTKVDRRSVRQGCQALLKLFEPAVFPSAQFSQNPFTLKSLDRYHDDAEKMLRHGLTEEEFIANRERMLAEPRARRDTAGWNTHPMVLLGLL